MRIELVELAMPKDPHKGVIAQARERQRRRRLRRIAQAAAPIIGAIAGWAAVVGHLAR